MKTKPKTIADLKINWTFEDYFNDNIADKEEKFKLQNKKLLKYKIKSDEYVFLVNNSSFTFYASSLLRNIECFIEFVNFRMTLQDIDLPKKLVKFELVEENTFRIHLK